LRVSIPSAAMVSRWARGGGSQRNDAKKEFGRKVTKDAAADARTLCAPLTFLPHHTSDLWRAGSHLVHQRL
jgi:hypothetical protein